MFVRDIQIICLPSAKNLKYISRSIRSMLKDHNLFCTVERFRSISFSILVDNKYCQVQYACVHKVQSQFLLSPVSWHLVSSEACFVGDAACKDCSHLYHREQAGPCTMVTEADIIRNISRMILEQFQRLQGYSPSVGPWAHQMAPEK